MTRIAVLSDIHIPTRMQKFPLTQVRPYLHQADVIFGLGDYVSQSALDHLYGFDKEVYAIVGNMDQPIIRQSLPVKQFIQIENLTIGIIHGWGAPYFLREKIWKELTKNGKSEKQIDLICYGHTHSTYWGMVNGVQFFNPGSLSNYPGTLGILTIDGKQIDHQIIEIKN